MNGRTYRINEDEKKIIVEGLLKLFNDIDQYNALNWPLITLINKLLKKFDYYSDKN